MKITFCGAAQVVTGSCYFIESDKATFLVDCGLFQGLEDEAKNYNEFLFKPSIIDFVLLTHAHIDHCGLLPKVVKEGFAGKIYCTAETAAIATELLYDAAKVQKYTKSTEKPILYDVKDVDETVKRLSKVEFSKHVTINNLNVGYYNAGHVLGAASVIVSDIKSTIVFSGDIGRKEQSVIKPFDQFEISPQLKPSAIVMESLYGGQQHNSRGEAESNLITIINTITERDGNVIIPAFSLHRVQELLVMLKKAFNNKQIKQDVQIFLDSPLAARINKIYTDAFSQKSALFNSDISNTENSLVNVTKPSVTSFNKFFEANSPFEFANLTIVKDKADSLRLQKARGAVIIAGSGMANGGKVVGHIERSISSHSNAIVIVGYQGEGTLGRDLADKKESVVIYGKTKKVKCQVFDLHGFSAHADTKDLEHWLGRFDKSVLKDIFLVHSEIERSSALKEQLDGFYSNVNIGIPQIGDSVEV